MARVRYNRGSIDSTVSAAIKTCGDRPSYVFATAFGFTIDRRPPPFGQQHVGVRPDGSTEFVQHATLP
jgi:hypothetical protein